MGSDEKSMGSMMPKAVIEAGNYEEAAEKLGGTMGSGGSTTLNFSFEKLRTDKRWKEVSSPKDRELVSFFRKFDGKVLSTSLVIEFRNKILIGQYFLQNVAYVF